MGSENTAHLENAGILGGKLVDLTTSIEKKRSKYSCTSAQSVIMSGLTDGDVVREFREFGIEVKLGSSELDKREFLYTWALFGV